MPPKTKLHARLVREGTFQEARPAGSRSRAKKNIFSWPHVKPPADKMAAAGFYYDPTSEVKDRTTCFMCLKTLDGWEPSDDPLEEHLSHVPDCSWARARSKAWKKESRAELETSSNNPHSVDSLNARLDTFTHWPHNRKKGWNATSFNMAKAGFYYNPDNPGEDTASCSYCDLSLDGWEPKDDPVEEHKRRSPSCLCFVAPKPRDSSVESTETVTAASNTRGRETSSENTTTERPKRASSRARSKKSQAEPTTAAAKKSKTSKARLSAFSDDGVEEVGKFATELTPAPVKSPIKEQNEPEPAPASNDDDDDVEMYEDAKEPEEDYSSADISEMVTANEINPPMQQQEQTVNTSNIPGAFPESRGPSSIIPSEQKTKRPKDSLETIKKKKRTSTELEQDCDPNSPDLIPNKNKKSSTLSQQKNQSAGRTSGMALLSDDYNEHDDEDNKNNDDLKRVSHISEPQGSENWTRLTTSPGSSPEEVRTTKKAFTLNTPENNKENQPPTPVETDDEKPDSLQTPVKEVRILPPPGHPKWEAADPEMVLSVLQESNLNLIEEFQNDDSLKDKTIAEWVELMADRAEEALNEKANKLISIVEEQGERAIKSIQNLPAYNVNE